MCLADGVRLAQPLEHSQRAAAHWAGDTDKAWPQRRIGGQAAVGRAELLHALRAARREQLKGERQAGWDGIHHRPGRWKEGRRRVRPTHVLSWCTFGFCKGEAEPWTWLAPSLFAHHVF